MRGDECLELGDDIRVSAERDLRIHQPLDRSQPKLLESIDLGAREVVVREVGERRSAPESERLAELSSGSLGFRAACLFQQLLETMSVQIARIELQDVPARNGEQGRRPEALTELRDVTLRAFAAVSGGCSFQSSSISRSAGTTSFSCNRRIASNLRCWPPPRDRRSS